MRTLDTWWSPLAHCWRVEDGEMFTYYTMEDVIAHLRDREATALLVATPHDFYTDLLVAALQRAGIPVVYAPA
jgi:hypothetical protein